MKKENKFYLPAKAVKFANNDRKMAIVAIIVITILGIHLKWYDFYILKWDYLIGGALRYCRLLPMLLHLFALWAQADKTKEYKEYKTFVYSYILGAIDEEDETEEPLK